MNEESSDPDLANFHLHLPLHVHHGVHTLEAIMQLLFLGTGAGDFQSLNDPTNDAPNIIAARRAGGRNLRYASSALIGADLLIDCHDTTKLHHFGKQTASIRNVLITHGHWDHFQPQEILDLAATLDEPLQVHGTSVVGESLAFAAEHEWNSNLHRFDKRADNGTICFKTLTCGDVFELDSTRVTAVRASHMLDKPRLLIEQPALNFVIERDDCTLFYGLDSSYLLPETLEMLANFVFDVVVLDATFGDESIDPAGSGHMTFQMILDTFSELRSLGAVTDSTELIASHISLAAVPPHDEIVDDLKRRGITLAFDGMTWTP